MSEYFLPQTGQEMFFACFLIAVMNLRGVDNRLHVAAVQFKARGADSLRATSVGSLSGLQDGRMMQSKRSLALIHVADHLKLTFRHDAALDLIPPIRPRRALSRCGSQNQPGLLTGVGSVVLHVGFKLMPPP